MLVNRYTMDLRTREIQRAANSHISNNDTLIVEMETLDAAMGVWPYRLAYQMPNPWLVPKFVDSLSINDCSNNYKVCKDHKSHETQPHNALFHACTTSRHSSQKLCQRR